MLKADMQKENKRLGDAVDKLEGANEKLAEQVAELAAERDELKTSEADLQVQVEKSQATLGVVRDIPAPDDHAAQRAFLEQLLTDIGHVMESGEVARRALFPARESITIALNGRWPDENDPDPERLNRVREIMGRN